MDTNINSDHAQQDSQLSLDESRELLSEVHLATEGTSQHNLSNFATLVCQVLQLNDCSLSDDIIDEGIKTFLDSSLKEIQLAMESEAPNSERIESLQTEALKRWGDRLVADDEFEFDLCANDLSTNDLSTNDLSANDLSTNDVWDIGDCEESDSEENHDTDADVVAPSAAEIASLLSSLGQTDTPPSDHLSESSELRAEAMLSHEPASELANASNAEPPTVTIASLDPELREAFLEDAASCVSSMEAALLRLESDPQHQESLNQICRELHTLKGASASVALNDLADQLHQLEDSLREDEVAGRAPKINSLLQIVDSIRSQVSEGSGPSPPESEQFPAHSTTDLPGQQASPPPLASFDEGQSDDESVRVKSSQLNRLMDMLAELVMLRNRRETELSELQEVYHELIGSVSKMRLLSNENHDGVVVSSSSQLSEIANDVLEVAQNVRTCARPVAEGNTAVSQFIRQFRKELVELRRTPVAGLFRRLQRVVRDAAHAESKEVQLVLLGEDAGIERSLQQRLYEPLLHIVRNCVCHGIESVDERARCGKPPIGTITLEATSGPDLFVIEIRDDGRGLDYDAIRRRGIETGLLAANQMASHEELSQLIFHPGFSTRQTANQTAGRGVGMDVVANTLQRMRGWLAIDSDTNRGTRIRLSFPLPSVIQHAMVFRSADQLFALPMQSVQRAGVIDMESNCLVLSHLLNATAGQNGKPRQGIEIVCMDPTTQGTGDRPSRITLLVDEIVGPEEVVVRPLPALLKNHPFCSGATLSGMGQTVLFLDAHRVVESHGKLLQSTKAVMSSGTLGQSEKQCVGDTAIRPRVLVVDDSISARKRVVRSLKRYAIDISEASNGREALQFLKGQRFAAVFTDMEMPHVSGMELLSEIRSRQGAQSPPVVIISSRGEVEFTDRAKQLGAHCYLMKPVADESLDESLKGIEPLKDLRANSTETSRPNGENQ
ncbi:Chemotaxis protein CheA [Planctomycetes bacterium CA13]|uniref:histidine kinase n=1 Tax=Novipirellula herctigrandis TaxID=2527986 RepID=A0A5C5ZAG4_9BACT|nr:Chemotaxis protein CheA [Planctomycetes bacterium CA13]